jgi:hypothetical protein
MKKNVKTFVPKGFKEIPVYTTKQMYGYIITAKGGSPIVDDGRMPIYWLMKVAKAEARKYPNSAVKKVWLMDMEQLQGLNHSNTPTTP